MKSDNWKYCPSCRAKTLSIIDNKWLICTGGAACEASESKTCFSLDYVRGFWDGYEKAERSAPQTTTMY